MVSNCASRMLCVSVLWATVASGASGQTILRVKQSSPSGDDGLSWTTAFDDLESALDASRSTAAGGTTVQIWISGGVFLPADQTDPVKPRSAMFIVPGNVHLIGGFLGSESSVAARKRSNPPTVISGDVLGDDGPQFANVGDNLYSLISVSGSPDPVNVVFDRLTISGAHSDATVSPLNQWGAVQLWSASVRLRECVFLANRASHFGAAALADRTGGSKVHATNCRFIENRGDNVVGSGAALGLYQTLPSTFVNCEFAGNIATAYPVVDTLNGLAEPGVVSFLNCTIHGNTSWGDTSAVRSVRLANCILWGNARNGSTVDFAAQTSSTDISYSILEGWSGSPSGPGNTAVAPTFEDADGADNIVGTLDDDLRLVLSSASGIDSGISGADTDVGTPGTQGYARADCGGRMRFHDGNGDSNSRIDIGAYEAGAAEVNTVLYVSASPQGLADGSSWANALGRLAVPGQPEHGSLGLQDAMASARAQPTEYGEIWVSGGSYKPSAPNVGGARSVAFELIDGVAIYGGFAGTESDFTQRDIEAYPTILSGDLNDNDPTDPARQDNSYHVVTSAGNGLGAVLDGLIIEKGHADGPAAASEGGGILVTAGAPEFRNVILRDNRAGAGGGAIIYQGADPLFVDCDFIDNRAISLVTTSGGGGAGVYGSATFRGTRFWRNHSETTYGGGALFLADLPGVSVKLFDCEFLRNSTVETAGGSASVQCMERTTIYAVNCSFLGNVGGYAAGISSAFDGMVDVHGCQFVGNHSFAQSGVAAGNECSVHITNTVFVDNQTESGPPGSLAAFGVNTTSSASLSNCIFWRNSAGGVLDQSGQMNTNNGSLSFEYNTIQGWTGSVDGPGNNGADPLFVRPPSPGGDMQWGTSDDDYGDLRPLPGSPAIDSADSLLVPLDEFDINGNGITTEQLPLDLERNPRFVDDPTGANTGPGGPPHVDRGCYESNPICDTCPGDRIWINPLGGDFEDVGNWILGVPLTGQPAVFNLANFDYAVEFHSNWTNARATITAGDVTWDLNGYKYTLNQPEFSSALVVGLSSPTPAVLRITEGTVESLGVNIAAQSAATGTIDVGAGSVLKCGPNLFIAPSGTGALLIHDGALVTANTGSIGELPGSSGLVDIWGAGSRLSFLAYCLINNGAVDVGPGATLRTGFGAFVQSNGQISGSGTVDGPVINIGDIDPGGIAPGTLTVTGDFIQFSEDPKFGNGAGRLLVTIAGGAPLQSDLLNVQGAATLGGGLIVERDAAFSGTILVPPGGLELLNADGGVFGFFDVAFLPAVGEQGMFFRAGTASPARGVGTSVVLTIEDLAALINTSANDVDNLGATPAAAVLGDFDGASGIDLAVALPNSMPGMPGDVIILYNNGSTGQTWDGWSMGAVQYPVGINPSGIDTAQLDGAPGLDLVISNEGDDSVTVLSNDGTVGPGQSFINAGSFTVGDAPSAVVAVDLDPQPMGQPSFADVATSNSGSGSVSLLQNRGVSGTWQGLGQSLGTDRVDLALPAGAAPRDLCAARLNAGNDLEIAVANTGTDSVSVISNDPTLRAPWGGGRSQIRPPEPTGPRPVTIQPIANPDEDKWDALGTTNFDGGSISVILNNTDGASIAFRPHVEVPIGADPASLVGVDLDNDGDEDLAVVARDDGGTLVVRVLRNDTLLGDAGATYSRDADITSTSNPLLVLAGNVNSTVDSTVDLVVLSDATLLAGARGMQPAESQVVLNVPPAPPPVCLGDADRNDTVNFTDILSVLANFGGGGPAGDADHNNIVNFNDVLSVLANFGAPCP